MIDLDAIDRGASDLDRLTAQHVDRMLDCANDNEGEVTPYMTIGSDLLTRHFETLVADNGQWQSLIDDDLLWDLVYAPSLGHPPRLSGREEVMRHVAWFLSAVENFRFFDQRVYPMADPDAAAAEVRAEALIKATARPYRQEYVVFLRSKAGKITHLREYFDPVRAAKALDTPISN